MSCIYQLLKLIGHQKTILKYIVILTIILKIKGKTKKKTFSLLPCKNDS